MSYKKTINTKADFQYNECSACKHIFTRNEMLKAFLENRTIFLECPLCHKKNIIRENIVCENNFGQIGTRCKKEPVFLIPYNTDQGLAFMSVCKDHFRHCDIPYSQFIPETHKAIEAAYQKSHPVLFSFFQVWMLFVIVGGPIMLVYSLAGAEFRFFAITQFSFFWLIFGLLWLVGYKSEFIKLPANLSKILIRIWFVIFIIILILEISIK